MDKAATAPRHGGTVTGLLLAGGLGRRMSIDGQGIDKGLQPFRGRPMAAHVLERLCPQVDAVLVSANANLDRWRAFGHPVLTDLLPDHAGPLAGLHAGLRAAATPRLVTVPCDSPFLPADLVARLAGAMDATGSPVAVARTPARTHPVFLMADRSVLAHLESFLETGRRRIDAWYGGLPHVEVEFPDEDAFRNINTPDDLRAFEPQ